MPDEITFQNDPVDPSVEFRKQHNHFFVASRVQRVSYHQVTLQLEDYAVWKDMPEEEHEDDREGSTWRSEQGLAEPAQHTGELDWDGAREWNP